MNKKAHLLHALAVILLTVVLLAGCTKSNQAGETPSQTSTPSAIAGSPSSSPNGSSLPPEGSGEPGAGLIKDQAVLDKTDLIEVIDVSTGEIRRYSNSQQVSEWVKEVGGYAVPEEVVDGGDTGEEGRRFIVQFFANKATLYLLTIHVPDKDQPAPGSGLEQAVLQLFARQGDKTPLPADCQKTTADLNGDGKKDAITFCGKEEELEFTVEVNDVRYTSYASTLTGLYTLTDLNKSDGLQEIAVSEEGPSADPRTYFLSYTKDGKIALLGKIPGYGEDITYHGDGALTTSMNRGSILHTWYYPKTFRLDGNRLLQPVDEPLYPMSTPVTLRQELKLVTTPNSTETAFTLKPGDKATLVASDDRAWCQLRTADGKEGWFEVEDFDLIKGTSWHSAEVFEGLSFAD